MATSDNGVSNGDRAGRRLRGPRRYSPPDAKGRYPWRKRWLGVVPLVAVGLGGAFFAWNSMEDGLDERAAVHLACEGIDADALTLDWSYRDVTVTGELPEGVSPSDIERILDQGSGNDDCLRDRGVDPDSDPGVYDVNIARLVAAPAVTPEPVATASPTSVPEPTTAPTETPTPQPTETPTPAPEPTATPDPTPTETPTPTPEPTEVPVTELDVRTDFDGQVLTLAGVVGTEAQRQLLVDAAVAAVGPDRVVDQLDVRTGALSASNDVLVTQLGSVLTRFGGDLVSGSASIAEGDLTWDLLAPNATAVASLQLPGSGQLDAAIAVGPEFTG